ncbi:hypothetical protein [Paractinoplanes maris]|uniref:hypothetical protein n=1 Tax=Paractinoplanes maris TaxID=1734446 RepID=UPI002020FCAD|nr:hypothetical protein [Actinoplanes maris]
MNDTALQSSPITLDRRLVLGEIDYQVTAFPTDDHRIDLCIVSSDGDGHVVSEISGGISPADLPTLTDVLTSTLAGLTAMTRARPAPVPADPPPDRHDRHPNQGARWSPADDARLIERHRAGARRRDLVAEFGRSAGGIRARLELLGELSPTGGPRPAGTAGAGGPATDSQPATLAAPSEAAG